MFKSFTMRYFIVAFLILFISVAGTAQTSGWALYLNKTKLLSASTDSLITTQLSESGKGKLSVVFPQRDKNFKRTVIIMNEQRNTLMQKDLKTSCRRASFSIDSLRHTSNGNAFLIYIADIPADPAKAMLVRMAPVAIGRVNWKK